MITPPCVLLGKRQTSRSDQPLEPDPSRLSRKPDAAWLTSRDAENGRLAPDETGALQKLLRDTARHFGLLP